MRAVDVAVIGGSLAGSACVRELIRAGVDAIAIERERFPREKVCGGFLSAGAVTILEDLNVLEAVRGAGAVEVRSVRFRTEGGEVQLPFRRVGLGVSRKLLDAVLADHGAMEQGNVASVERAPGGRFHIHLSEGERVDARVVIDAAGKLSRFGKLKSSPQFGVRYYENEHRGDAMDFWFFPDGYGGIVGIEGERANACFLIRRDALHRYLDKPGCQVTGPVAYRSSASEFIAVGDAAGMIDPFCGEGMHHALDTGRIAAAAVMRGLDGGWSYLEMRQHYERERMRQWWRKRALARVVRVALQYPRLRDAGLRVGASLFVDAFWS